MLSDQKKCELNMLSPEQYKALYNMSQADKIILFNEIKENKEKFILETKRFPLEIFCQGTSNSPAFRTVFMGKDSIEFLLTILEYMVKE